MIEDITQVRDLLVQLKWFNSPHEKRKLPTLQINSTYLIELMNRGALVRSFLTKSGEVFEIYTNGFQYNIQKSTVQGAKLMIMGQGNNNTLFWGLR